MPYTPRQIKAIADRAEARSKAPSQIELAERVEKVGKDLRAAIDKMERKDSPIARHPLVQEIKAFTNEVDAWVQEELRAKY